MNDQTTSAFFTDDDRDMEEFVPEKKETDSTLPDHTAQQPVNVKSLKDVIAEQREISDVNKGAVRLAQISPGNVLDNYDIMEVLGTGMTGSVKKARNKKTGQLVALKEVRTKLLTKPQRNRLFNEVHVALLMDHPHIVKLFEVHQTDNSLALCLEICEGGALLNHIQKVKHLHESEAARITRQMCLALSYMHSPATPGGQMCHRDLKLENFMFASKNHSEPHIKLIDFGLSRVCERGSEMTLFAGSLHYYSPELLDRCYDHRCDLWALGVVVYIMLFGVPPFTAHKNALTYARIRRGTYRIHYDISPEARDFLARFLQIDPERRTPVKDMTEHAWLTKYQGVASDEQPSLSPELSMAFQVYASSGVFKRAALKLVSLNIPAKQLKDLREIFTAVDVGHDGVITLQELTNAIEQSFQQSGESPPALEDLKEMFHQLDLNKTECITYSEFLAACLQAKFDFHDYRELLEEAFQKFDRDGSGAITADNLREILGDEYNSCKVEDLIAECDHNKNGQVNIHEFLDYLSGQVAAEAVHPEKEDGLAGKLQSHEAVDEAAGDSADIVHPLGDVKDSSQDKQQGAEATPGQHGDAFKVVSGLMHAVDSTPELS